MMIHDSGLLFCATLYTRLIRKKRLIEKNSEANRRRGAAAHHTPPPLNPPLLIPVYCNLTVSKFISKWEWDKKNLTHSHLQVYGAPSYFFDG